MSPHLIVLFIIFEIISSGSSLKTNSGLVRGKIVKDDLAAGSSYWFYGGIPYAEPPTENLRFRPPVPKNPWSETLDATKYGPVCPQAEGTYNRSVMSEDCLNLNIYRPSKKRCQTPLPVVVFVHGGEFKSGSGRTEVQYGPQFFLSQGIIFATLNYRLGALGFLSLNTEAATGNAALKDVMLGLKWIKDNIRYFGGNPNNITVGGQSAGAVLVHYLTLSNQSSGLFQRVFLNSGSALGARFLAKHPVENAFALGVQLGFNSLNAFVLLENLIKANVFDIVAAQDDMGKNDRRNGMRPFAPFVPSVEITTESAVITKEPLDIVKSGIPQDVPIIAGFTAQEGNKMVPAVVKNRNLIEYINKEFELCIPSNIEYPYGSEESLNLAKAIKRFYFDGKDISNETMSSFVDLVTDTQMSYAVDSWIQTHTARSNTSLYHYVFDFDGDFNFFKLSNPGISLVGTSHADDLGYMFVTEVTKPILLSNDASDDSRTTMTNFISMWSSFAKFGNPTPNFKNPKTIWTPSTDGSHLLLNNAPVMNNGRPIEERLNFWYTAYDDYQQYLDNGGVVVAKFVP